MQQERWLNEYAHSDKWKLCSHQTGVKWVTSGPLPAPVKLGNLWAGCHRSIFGPHYMTLPLSLQLRRLLARFLPPYGLQRQFEIADKVSATLVPQLRFWRTVYGLDFDKIPVNKMIQPLLGFITGAADVVSQSYGGRPGGPESINGSMRIYQAIFAQDKVEPLMQVTFALFNDPPPDFESGNRIGSVWGNAIISKNAPTAAQTAMDFFPTKFGQSCVYPEGRMDDKSLDAFI